MSNAVFPALPGLTFDSVKTPQWSTFKQRSTGGMEVTGSYYSVPRWKWQLGFEFLREFDPFREWKTLAGFFNARQGGYDSFLYDDPTDDVATAQPFGTGNGTTTTFQLGRTLDAGGLFEPIYNLPVASATYWNAGASYGSVAYATLSAPGGWRLEEDGSTGQHYAYANLDSVTAGQSIVASMDLYAGQRTKCLVYVENGTPFTNRFGATVDLAAGSVAPYTLGTGTVQLCRITPLPQAGWYRVQIRGTLDTTSTAAYTIVELLNASGSSSYAGIAGYGLSFRAAPLIARNDWQGNQLLSNIARTNSLIYSQTFTSWSLTGATAATGVATAPDGTSTANAIYETATTGQHYASEASGAFTAGQVLCFSLDVKAGARSMGRYAISATDAIGVDFDLTAVTATAFQSGSGLVTAVAIAALPAAGWYRVSFVGILNATATTGSVSVAVKDAAGDLSYAGTAGDGFYVWGAQQENGAHVPGSYIPTTTAAVTVTDYTMSAGLITLAVAPLTAAALTWSGQYYWRCRFTDDANDFTYFAYQFWSLQQILFESVKGS